MARLTPGQLRTRLLLHSCVSMRPELRYRYEKMQCGVNFGTSFVCWWSGGANRCHVKQHQDREWTRLTMGNACSQGMTLEYVSDTCEHMSAGCQFFLRPHAGSCMATAATVVLQNSGRAAGREWDDISADAARVCRVPVAHSRVRVLFARVRVDA